MPFIRIAGSFHVTNYSPDGDSIRFKASDPALLKRLRGIPKLNAQGHVQLRLEGIDTLETHWTPPSGGGVFRQPEQWARAAVEELLDFTGISNVRWNAGHTQVTAADDGTPGFILSRSADKFGRPIAFLFAGEAGQDGADVRLDPEGLSASYNHRALEKGLAYPTFYRELFSDLRDELARVAQAARDEGKGLWSVDRTTAGFSATDLSVISDQVAILPKLFRRLGEHMVATGSAVDFKEVMEASKEPVLDLRTSNFTHLDTFIEQPKGSVDIKLTRNPEELVFDPMPLRPADHFAKLLGAPDQERLSLRASRMAWVDQEWADLP